MFRILRNRRVLAAVALIAVLLAVALWPRAVPVDLEPVGRGPLQVTIDEEGKTRVRERFAVSAPVAGRVLRIPLEPGDAVERDRTILATFRPEDPALLDARARAEAEAQAAAADAAVGRAEAERQRAAASLELARSEERRHRDLAASGVVSEDQLDAKLTAARTAEESLRAAEFAVSTARGEAARARARLMSSGPAGRGTTIELRSPIDGVVLQRFRESESIVPAGEPLLEVADPANLEIVADLLSTDAVRVRSGQPVIVDRWGGGATLRGRVRRVEPFGFTKISALGVEEQRVNVVIDFEDPREGWNALGDGYRVEVRIVVWDSPDVVTVPTTALFRRGERWAAFVSDNRRARLVEIDVGERNEAAAEVRGGLAPGAMVIAHPSDRITDGTRVVPRGD